MQTVEADLDAVMVEKVRSAFLGLVTSKGSSMSRSPRPGGLIAGGSDFTGRVGDRGVEVFSKQLAGMEVALRGLVKTIT